jgi:hypothetical protein
MVDPRHLEEIQRLPDILRRTFFPGVGDREETFIAGPVEDGAESLGGIADL